LLFFCVLACVAPHYAHAQATRFVDSKSCGSNPGCTTAAMNNTAVGASGLIVIGVTSFNDASLATVSCSNPSVTGFAHTSNYASTSGSKVHTAIFYKLAPSVGSAQTCTVANGGYTSMFVETFSNVGAPHGS